MRKTMATVMTTLAVMMIAGTALAQWQIVQINTNTGAAMPSGIGGLTWNGTAVDGGPATTTVNVHYDPASVYAAGDIHLIAWNVSSGDHPPVYYSVNAVDDIRGLNTIIVDNPVLFSGDIYWYAWFDTDGDGVLNAHDYGSDTNYYFGETSTYVAEPAAAAEFFPHNYSNQSEEITVEFWLVNTKADTPRFGEILSDPNDTRTSLIRSLTGGGTHVIRSPMRWGTAMWTEFSYMASGYTRSVSGNAVSGLYGGLGWNLEARHTLETLTNSTLIGTWNYQWDGISVGHTNDPIQDANAVVYTFPQYPVNGATVTSTVIDFAFTNDWKYYPVINIRVSPGTVYTKTNLVYDHLGYLENEHYDDGLTYHRSSALPLIAGSNYAWSVRVTHAQPGNVTFDESGWSTNAATFFYTNSP